MKYSNLSLFILLLSIAELSFGQSSQADSLKAVLESLDEDTSKVSTLIAICQEEYNQAPADALLYGNEALDLSERLDYQKGMALANKFIGLCYYFQGDYWKTINYWQQSLISFEAINDKAGISNIHNNIGAVYYSAGDETRALEYYQKSLEAAKEAADTLRIITVSLTIGNIFLDIDSTYNKAQEYFLAALPLIESLGDHNAEGIATVNLGEIYYGRGELDTALYYYERSLDALKVSNSGNVPFAMTCIGKVYMQREEFGKAIEIQKEAYEIAEMSDAKLEMTSSLFGLAETYFRQGDITSSISTYRKAEKIAEEIGANYELREVYRELSDSYAVISDYQNAYKYLSLKHDIDSLLLILSDDRQTELMNFSNNILKQEKETEIEVLQQQSMIEQLKSRRQKAVIIGIGSLGLLLLVLAVRFYKQTQYIKGINVKIKGQHDEIKGQHDEIEAQRDEIEAQRDEVEAQRDLLETQRDVVVLQKDEIIDSINYAKRIQSAMLPPEIYITELLNENFILYKPRDIVSGDFYWIKQVKQYIIVLAADCTGHGVPGALMSMLGISYLNEIVQRREITQANQILNELRKQIKFSLRQHGKPDEAKDGIDMALCVLDLKNMRMQYAGANSPLYLIRDVEDISELQEIKPDRMPIGYYQGKDKTFTNLDIQLEIGDTFYIFSDGYIDQKGGKDNKKFMSKNFKNLLLEVHDQAMHDQKEILENTLSDWMGDHAQIDDLLVVGVRV